MSRLLKVFSEKRYSVLFTLDSFDIGGVVTVTKLHAQILADKGIPVLILGRKGNIDDPSKVFQNCIILVIPEKVHPTLIGRVWDMFSYISYLTKVYKNYRIRYVHFTQTWSSLYTLLHPGTVNRKCLLTFHGAYDLENRDYSSGLLANIVNKLRNRGQQFVLNKSEGVIVLSNYSKQLIIDHFSIQREDKIQIIPGSV